MDEICGDSMARADLVLNLHGGTRSMWLTLLSAREIPRRIRAPSLSAFSIRHKIPRAQEILGVDRAVHTAEHLASAMFWLGVPQRRSRARRLVVAKTFLPTGAATP